MVPYPDAAINKFDPDRPDKTLISVQSVVADPANRLLDLDTAYSGIFVTDYRRRKTRRGRLGDE